MSSEKGKVFIISGPSGCGKSTLLHNVFAVRTDLYFSISATTRGPRPGEQDGVDYWFIPRERFLEMIDNDELLEHAEYVGNFYGTPIGPIMEKTAQGIDVVLDIEVQGAQQVMKKLPDAISVFIAPPSIEELERRLRGRSTETEEKIANRLKTARKELELSKIYDRIVINDDIQRASAELLGIINSENIK